MEILHCPGSTRVKPRAQVLPPGAGGRRSDSATVETGLGGEFLDDLAQNRRPHGRMVPPAPTDTKGEVAIDGRNQCCYRTPLRCVPKVREPRLGALILRRP